MKRKVSIFMTLIMILSMLFNINVFAAEYIATAQINVYRYTSCRTRGTCNPAKSYNAYISKGDDVNIYSINDSYVKVDYPTSSGRRTGYIKKSDYNKYIKKDNKTSNSTNSSELLFPLKGKITRSSSVKTNGYYCDYKTGGSVAVYAPADGTVTFKQAYNPSSNKLCSYGNYFEFKSNDGVYKVKCCHLSSFNNVNLKITKSLSYPCSSSKYATKTYTLKKNKAVKKGDLLGYSGYTGNASGHHLHLEVYKNGKAVNPTNVFSEWN